MGQKDEQGKGVTPIELQSLKSSGYFHIPAKDI